MIAHDTVQKLQTAFNWINARQYGDAWAMLNPIVQANPDFPDGRHLMGLALAGMGQPDAAEFEFQRSIELNPNQPQFWTNYADFMADVGRLSDAETAYRRALAIQSDMVQAQLGLARVLSGLGRGEEALAITTPLTAKLERPDVFMVHGNTLKTMERFDEAVPFFKRGAELAPDKPRIQHNYASILGDAGMHAEAEAVTRKVFDLGLVTPETWIVRARALQGIGRYDDAEAAFRETLKLRPGYTDALRDLAQLIWMRTEDVNAATADIDRAIAATPADTGLTLTKVKVLEYAGADAAAEQVLEAALTRFPDDPGLLYAATLSAARLDQPELALKRAEKAVALAPENVRVVEALCNANLMLGRGERASEIAALLREFNPNDQYCIALQAMAWRLQGDPRYRQLYDYDVFVRPYTIDTPAGWSDLPTFLSDLKARLKELHAFRTHPLDQSLRHGSQTAADLRKSKDPVIMAFFEAIRGPISRHVQYLGAGEGPLRSRNTGQWKMRGTWSVWLRPDGFHVDHVHPQGWLSSACYIDLPPAVEAFGKHEGWIKFGEHPSKTRPPLGPEHYVKPEEGRLVLFPSYMWHGTVPFTGQERRMTVAFDILPA